MKTILSLCDYSGRWPEFYRQNGYRVITLDIKTPPELLPGREHLTCDVLDAASALDDIGISGPGSVHGILAAPPCTDFAVSGAQYWKAKDADGRTAKSVEIITAIQWLINDLRPVWWALENPVGRLREWMGAPAWNFNPCDYAGYLDDPAEQDANRYTKKTLIWGNARKPWPKPLEPVRVCTQGSWIMKLGGKSERTKELRSMTPLGFAKAFTEINI